MIDANLLGAAELLGRRREKWRSAWRGASVLQVLEAGGSHTQDGYVPG